MTDFMSTRTVKARKPRTCPECREVISTGSAYVRHAGVSEGDFFCAVQCAPCAAFSERYLRSLDGAGFLNPEEKTYTFGSMLEEALEFACGDFREYRYATRAQLRDLLPPLLDEHDASERLYERPAGRRAR